MPQFGALRLFRVIEGEAPSGSLPVEGATLAPCRSSVRSVSSGLLRGRLHPAHCRWRGRRSPTPQFGALRLFRVIEGEAPSGSLPVEGATLSPSIVDKRLALMYHFRCLPGRLLRAR